MIAFLFLFAIASALLGALAMWLVAVALRVPPLVVSAGSGPKLFELSIGPTRVRVGVLTFFGAYQEFEDGERRAARLPGFGRRLIVAVTPAALFFAIAAAALGVPALGETARGFSQIFQVAWPFGDGVDLVGKFDALLASHGDLVAAGVLSAKLAAFNLMHAATSGYLWYGSFAERRPPWWVILPLLVWLLAAIGAAITTARYLL